MRFQGDERVGQLLLRTLEKGQIIVVEIFHVNYLQWTSKDCDGDKSQKKDKPHHEYQKYFLI